jgi:hypothetical protein
MKKLFGELDIDMEPSKFVKCIRIALMLLVHSILLLAILYVIQRHYQDIYNHQKAPQLIEATKIHSPER